jgi:hypothetical protein
MTKSYDRWEPLSLLHTDFTDETHSVLVDAEFARVLELCVIARDGSAEKAKFPQSFQQRAWAAAAPYLS